MSADTDSKPKTPKKAPKARKPKAASGNHPKYLEMTVAAIGALKERNGSSRQAIHKYILTHFDVGHDPKSVNTHLKMALKRGATTGALKHVKGQGASGSFRLSDSSAAKKAGAKTAKSSPKKAATKKASSPKKTASKKAKSPAKKKSPAKPKKPKVKKAAPAAASSPSGGDAKPPAESKPKKKAKSPKKKAASPKKAKSPKAKPAKKSPAKKKSAKSPKKKTAAKGKKK